MFMFLVLIHEFGHFLVAKKKGVKVLEFGIGIPPKVCNLRKDKS
jgi:regulator of sigma E protease